MTALLIANDGGHLMQLHTLLPRLGVTEDRLWVTPRTDQSVSLLRDEQVFWAHRAPSRDVAAVIRNAGMSRALFGQHHFTRALSTGSSLALSLLPLARLRGIPTSYIESATRVSGPSSTGRLLQRVPGIRLYCQYPEWAEGGWAYGGSVFDGFTVRSRDSAGSPPQEPVTRDTSLPLRAVVSLGTSERYGFRRLLERMVSILPPDADVLWQTGSTDASGLGISAMPSMPAARLDEALRLADFVVSHAGTGIALSALRAGKLPILVPRSASRGEHVDDHQQQIAVALKTRGLAVVREVEDLSLGDLRQAAAMAVTQTVNPPPFHW